jgi:hypothetical protein
MFDRGLAIRELTDLMLDECRQGCLSFEDIMMQGFVGLCNMTDEELMQELSDRDVSYVFGETE